jgi:hypothetical protein
MARSGKVTPDDLRKFAGHHDVASTLARYGDHFSSAGITSKVDAAGTSAKTSGRGPRRSVKLVPWRDQARTRWWASTFTRRRNPSHLGCNTRPPPAGHWRAAELSMGSGAGIPMRLVREGVRGRNAVLDPAERGSVIESAAFGNKGRAADI